MIHIHDDSKLNIYCRLIMQVHDELIFEVPKSDEKTMIKIIKEEMMSVDKSCLLYTSDAADE